MTRHSSIKNEDIIGIILLVSTIFTVAQVVPAYFFLVKPVEYEIVSEDYRMESCSYINIDHYDYTGLLDVDVSARIFIEIVSNEMISVFLMESGDFYDFLDSADRVPTEGVLNWTMKDIGDYHAEGYCIYNIFEYTAERDGMLWLLVTSNFTLYTKVEIYIDVNNPNHGSAYNM